MKLRQALKIVGETKRSYYKGCDESRFYDSAYVKHKWDRDTDGNYFIQASQKPSPRFSKALATIRKRLEPIDW